MNTLKTNDIEHVLLNTRTDYLKIWYSQKYILLYRRYLRNNNHRGLKSICACYNESQKFCPACEMRYLREKYTKK